MMTNEELFNVWAPADALWSQWAKPVLFVQRSDLLPPSAAPVPASADDRRLPPASGQRAIVVDLPALEALHLGLALATRGHRPVPLYNTCDDPAAVLDVRPLMVALAAAAAGLQKASLPPDAPPVFLLDSHRMRPTVLPSPGKFDNRWVVFPQDFPSATFLHSRGIREVVLIHDGSKPQDDLAHVLRRWQDAGLAIHSMTPQEGTPRSITVEKPSWFKTLGYRLVTIAGLRRNNTGGFGAVIPIARSGGGYG